MYCVGEWGAVRVGLGARRDGPGGLLNKIKMSCYANIDVHEIFMLRLIIWCIMH